ncbi:phage tail tape measure protein [Mesorhizobium sp. J428]|uniref:phage tail tape measure protein n=1 Tax=Mesorhizobium sp. J428 TaxID=2898440 RepID=UPI002150C2F2|nr:phage tail tape measure protein [Mesorhizobium sp. J428]MCR5856579.1 phage tail tape measure protein [Mesorhizobium sp. J428]
MAGEADAERLVVLLEARLTDFERNMLKASGISQKNFNAIRKASKSATRDMEQDMIRSTSRINQALATSAAKVGSYGKAFVGGFVGGIVGGGLAGIVAQVGKIAEGVAEVGRQAKMAGVGVKSFSELSFVVEQARIPVDTLADGLKELNLRADEFITTGKGSAAEAFGRLGYSAEDLAKKLEDPTELFTEIIGKLQQFDKAAQIRISDELFGGQAGERFVELIDLGADGIRKQISFAREMGLVMDKEMVAKAAEVDRKFNLIAKTIGTAVKSAIVDAVSAWFEFLDSYRDFQNQGDQTLVNRAKDLDAQRLEIENRILEAQNRSGMTDRARAKTLNTLRIELEKIDAQRAQVEAELQRRAPETPSAAPQTIAPRDNSADYIAAYRKELELTNRERAIAAEQERILADAVGRGITVTQDQARALAEEKVARDEAEQAASKAAANQERAQETTDRERAAVRELIAELEQELQLVGASEETKRAANALRMAGAAATEEERNRIVALNEELYRSQEQHERLAEASEFFNDTLGDAMMDLIPQIETGNAALDRFLNTLLEAVAQAVLLGKGPLAGLFGDLFGGGKGGSSGKGGGFLSSISSASDKAPSVAPASDVMQSYRDAIASIESAGSGDYNALGPWTKGDRAYGRYQVMGQNVPSWTKDALGREMTPAQFLADPSAQDAVFDHRFGSYLTKYGNPQDAASAWFTGGPLKNGAGASDVLGTTGSAYVEKFNTQLKLLGDTAASSVDGLKTFDTSLVDMAGKLTSKDGPLGGLFGTGLDNFGNFMDGRNGGLGALLGYGGGSGGGGGGLFGMLLSFLPKLLGFANGTHSAPGGLSRINERGGEIIDLPKGSRVIPHDVSMRMADQARSQPGKVDLNVNITGASGDDHVRKLAAQGARQAIWEYNEGLANGGFGDVQRRYISQKA